MGCSLLCTCTLVTDIASGYDHIAIAIGSATSALKGVDLLCYLTSAKNFRLPNKDKLKEGLLQ
jgi:phosphomethylpyrimidine synthase